MAHLPPADDPAIQTWFSRLDNPHTQKSYGHYFDEWLEYLHRKPGYENVTPAKLIEMQDAATTKIDRYKLLTLLQEYVSTLELAKRTRVQAYTAVRSFFLHNHSELPTDTTYQIKGKKPPAPKNLTTENVHDILKAATLRDRSLLTVKWQSLLDTAGLVYLNENMGEHLANEIKAGHCPILLGNFPGRKSTGNEPRGTFYTFISTDSIAALKEYFEKERGWPAKGEPVWKDTNGKVIYVGFTYTSPSEIPVGGRCGFKLNVVGSERSYRVARYSLTAESENSRYTSVSPGATTTTTTQQQTTTPVTCLIADHLVINEVELNPVGNDTANEWVELYNPTTAAIDLTGWAIKNRPAENQVTVAISPATISPNGYHNVSYPMQWLDNNNETLVLLDSSQQEVDSTPWLNDTMYGDLEGYSWQRYPDGCDHWAFAPSTSMTVNVPELFSPVATAATALFVTVFVVRRKKAVPKSR